MRKFDYKVGDAVRVTFFDRIYDPYTDEINLEEPSAIHEDWIGVILFVMEEKGDVDCLRVDMQTKQAIAGIHMNKTTAIGRHRGNRVTYMKVEVIKSE